MFYEKKIEIDRISFEVLTSSEKEGIWLAGPSKWPPVYGAALPMAAVWKTSTKVNIGTSPETHGHLVLSREIDGQPILLKLFAHDKLPLEGDDSKPNSRPPEEKEQFSVGEGWFDVEDKLLIGRPGPWIAAVISGSAISNVHKFDVLDSGPSLHEARPALTKHSFSGEDNKQFLAGNKHPLPPDLGIEFRLDLGIPGKDSPKLMGSFAFPVPNAESTTIHLAALFSGPNFEEMRRIPIAVPFEATRIVNEKLVGFFSLDLKEKLGNPRQKSFALPPLTYLTFVGRNWIGKPTLLDSANTE